MDITGAPVYIRPYLAALPSPYAAIAAATLQDARPVVHNTAIAEKQEPDSTAERRARRRSSAAAADDDADAIGGLW